MIAHEMRTLLAWLWMRRVVVCSIGGNAWEAGHKRGAAAVAALLPKARPGFGWMHNINPVSFSEILASSTFPLVN